MIQAHTVRCSDQILTESPLHALYTLVQAYGVRPDAEINASLAPTTQLNTTATTAAECQDLVRRDHPDANAAEYSNTGHVWCKAVFNACVDRSTQSSTSMTRVLYDWQ